MSTITTVRLWNDPGFTEGTVEVPGVNTELPPATQTFTQDFNANTDVMFSKITVAGPYSILMNTSYIEITVDWTQAHPQTYYGWVDKVELKSDTQGFNSTNIYWHVDLWRTYLKQAQFGYGMVMRRPLKENDMVPPQPYPHRFSKASGNEWSITSEDSKWWVFINVNLSSGTITGTTTLACPVSITSPSSGIPVGQGTAPPLDAFIKGSWDEELGLVPENVTGVFLSPLKPNVYSAGQMPGWNAVKVSDSARAYAFVATGVNSIIEFTVSMTRDFVTDDTTRYVVTGLDGEVIGELPWGVPISTFHSRCVIDSTSGYIQIRSDIHGHADGLCFTIPMIPIELSQNSWSSYAYTGARQADIQQRALDIKTQRDSAMLNAGLSAGGNVAQGLIGAGIAGLGGPIGIGLGVASTAMSMVSAQANYKYQQGVNDKAQAIQDYRVASQPNGLIMSGSGFDCIRFGTKAIMLVEMMNDEYSVNIRNEDIELFGAHVCEPTDDCTALVQAGGGLMISNLIVKGDIPVEAKAYIKARLQGGVRIV